MAEANKKAVNRKRSTAWPGAFPVRNAVDQQATHGISPTRSTCEIIPPSGRSCPHTPASHAKARCSPGSYAVGSTLID